MVINASEQFGIDLNDEVLTSDFAKQFPTCSTGPLEIDFRRCIIDYEATSRIMDAAIDAMSNAAAPRMLVALFDINFQERLYLKWLFLGSRILQLDKATATDEEIKERVHEGFLKRGIVFCIRITNPSTGAEAQSFQYG